MREFLGKDNDVKHKITGEKIHSHSNSSNYMCTNPTIMATMGNVLLPVWELSRTKW